MAKQCCDCKLEKPDSEFYLCKARKGTKLHCRCILCGKIRRKEYYWKNVEKAREDALDWICKHKEETKQRSNDYYYNNRDKQLSEMKLYRQKNFKTISEQNRVRYQKRKAEAYSFFINLLRTYPILITHIAKTIERRELNAKIAERLRGRIGKKLRQKDLKQTSSFDLIGCSVDEFRQHIENQWQSEMSWSNHGAGKGKWQLDHKQPCCSFDLRDINQQKKCFHYSNLQPLWFKEHRYKTSQDIKSKFNTL